MKVKRFRCRRRPRILRSLMAERREKPFNIFQKVAINIRKPDANTYEKNARCGNWALTQLTQLTLTLTLFLHLLHTKPQQGELS